MVEGSHELVRRMVRAAPDHDAGSSSDVRARPRDHEFFDRLAQPDPEIAAFMETVTLIDDARLRVGEITGDAAISWSCTHG